MPGLPGKPEPAAAPAGLLLVADSVVRVEDQQLELAASGRGAHAQLVVRAARAEQLAGFEGESSSQQGGYLLVGPRSPSNVARLRALMTWLAPRPLGLQCSFGFGDRLGLATPGHIRALRVARTGLRAVFAQQSMREMARTGRGPQQVMDDATWGVFSSGWHHAHGADADHVKTADDVETCTAAGYTMFTFDPGDHVRDGADSLDGAELGQALEGLPWTALEDSPRSMLERYRHVQPELSELGIAFSDEAAARAAVKYGSAVAHAARLYRRLCEVAPPDREVEISVDETDSSTTHFQHVYIATELARLGVRWVSLAPRFVGRFEKASDYIGDPAAFEADCAVHAGIARRLGPYKLSLHSGSDKLSIYAAFRRATGALAHVKTAGTSYLEALRTLARTEPGLFREIYEGARRRYGEDRATYMVSARIEATPDSARVADAELPALLDDFHVRQVLHVTFGSAVDRFGERLHVTLNRDLPAYEHNLERHFVRHLHALETPR
ncbi:MAG TPA: tagaturonate epimerase family protein [Candidatus Dormibacteraeota bacterium]|nr:tagaturonate epimerase family protein [Candidatus Dormibacteraeota bacterium]